MNAGLLRLRSDAYYVPVPNGVWIRTTDGSFTLTGGTVATWVEKLAPLLDRGVVPEELLGALGPDRAPFVQRLLKVLEERKVVRRERPDDRLDGLVRAGLFPQQVEFLRHFTTDPAAGLDRARSLPVALAGPVERAAPLAAALMETGFGDIALLDAEPDVELRDMAADLAGRGAPVRLSGPDAGAAGAGRTLIGIVPPGTAPEAWRLLDRAEAAGAGAWVGLVQGQALLLKGQMPGSGRACVRCAWRRLAHRAVALPGTAGLGTVPVSVAATVLAQELFQYVAAGDDGVLGEGVVVDLTRLSIWRTAVDPDPGCPGHGVHPAGPGGLAARGGSRFPESVFGARCFGPLFSCAPEQLPQFPLTALRVRLNPPGRSEPAGSADGPVVVAETMADARAEAAITAVEATLTAPGGDGADGSAVGVGRDAHAALTRALLHWADAAWADAADARRSGAGRSEAGRGGGAPTEAVRAEAVPAGAVLPGTVAGGVPVDGASSDAVAPDAVAPDDAVPDEGAALHDADGPRSRRVLRLAESAPADLAVHTEGHPSGLWRTRVDGPSGTVVRTGLDPDQAEERALLTALAHEQLGARDAAGAVAAVPSAALDVSADAGPDAARATESAARRAHDSPGEPVPTRTAGHPAAIAAALGLVRREAALPPLVAGALVGVVLTPGPAA
ncbi:hypothetical protein JS756_04295 [Streptomyces actuosus]|uniref:Uncharacterized protein n=1 Tax=Streptomyces actuosus TaxID=1885 RepID=A0ABS2VJP3_STRAS|nr:hypothetical protein [Streptomyces actuosus]MBN0043329.1 hypothetical protein [Streptomyces actuosus]